MDRRRFLAAAAALAVGGLTACSAPRQIDLVTTLARVDTADGLTIDGQQIADAALWEQAQSEGGLTLYTGYVENSEKEVIKAFAADTGLDVSMVRLVPNRLLERVLSEHGAGRLGADVIRISDPSGVASIAEAGALERHRVPGYDELGVDVSYDDGLYYRCFDPAFTFAYNTMLVAENERPSSWWDLTDPRLRGRIGITQAGAGGSSLSLLRFQREVLGDDFLHALAAQRPRIFDSSGAMQESLARGELDVTTAVVSSVTIAASKDAPVRFVVPDEGFALYDYFLAMASSATRPAAGQVFCNWNLSRRGASVFSQIGEYPAIADAGPPQVMGIDLPSTGSGLPHRPDPADLAAHQADDQQFFNTVFGYLG